MPSIARINRIANLIATARKAGQKQPLPPEELIPATATEAEAVQVTVALQMGGIGGYKVMKARDSETGIWGIISAPRIYAAHGPVMAPELLIELEVAFRFRTDLPGHEDGSDYSLEEVEDAIEGALPVYELLSQRWQVAAPSLFPTVLLNHADTLGNWGLAYGTLIPDWKKLVRDDLKVALTVGGKQVVSQTGGHVSGNPAAPLLWLANALSRHGHGIVAGQIVTTGAFGGAHLIKAGEEATGTIEGFAPISLKLS
ncbi:MAG: fumarylacetoacetate hydrolase family protein [Rhizomicrobium sp.]